MVTTSVSRTYTFSAAHCIEGHPKCGRIHGHNYEVTVTIEGSVRDENGMVIDFGDIDKIVKPSIDELDHRFIVSQDNLCLENPYALLAIDQGHAALATEGLEYSTAEHLAQFLMHRFNAQLTPYGVDCTAVTVSESPRNSATARLVIDED